METIKLDLIPGKKMPSLHASQYDDGREHGIDLFENGIAYKLDGTETLTINERKVDNNICSMDIENTFSDSNHIVFASTEQMCAVWGNNICELVIAKGEKTIGTLNFILEIEQSPTEGGIESESEIKNLERQIEAITEEVIGEDYYTKTQTDEAISEAIEDKADTSYVDTELAKKADKSNTYTKTQVDDKLSEKANADDVYQKTETYSKTETDNLVSPKADKTYVDTQLQAKANASDVYTKSQTDNLLNDKADVTDLPDMTQYYDKSEVDDLLDDKANSDDVYGKAYIDTALSGKANVGTSYTKSEEDALLDDKADKSDTYTKEQVDDIVYNILPDDTASGSVANFDTSLELPIKSLEVDVNAVQESGTPTPASPLPISGWNEISLVKCGANLWNENWEIGSFDNTGNPITSNDKIRTVDFIPCKPNVPYYAKGIGMVLFFYDKDKTFISSTSKTNSSFTTPLDAYFIKFRMVTGYGTTYNNDLGINYPPTETDYIAYNRTNEVINLGGTYYGGHFTQDKDGKRKFTVTHNYFLMDNSVNVSVPSQTDNTVVFSLALADNNIPATDSTSYMSDKFSNITPSDTEGRGVLALNGYFYFVIAKEHLNSYDQAGARAWLANNPAVLITSLATPYDITLPDGEPIITFNGTNNIYADTGDTSVVFKCSVNDYINAHQSGGSGAKSLGGVFLGGSNSGSEEEPTEEEPKEVTKTLGDEPISKK